MFMTQIQIEGDYVDSFVYSGTLFLLDAQMRLTSYPWNEVLNLAIKNHSAREYLLNVFRGKRNKNIQISDSQEKKLVVEKKDLENISDDSTEFDFWLTDMDIFRNTLFVSSNEGVISQGTNRTDIGDNPKFEFTDKRNNIFSEPVLDMAIGEYSNIVSNIDFARMIVSCGDVGAYQISTKGKNSCVHDEHGIYPLSSEYWIGCDLNTNIGLAVLKNFSNRKIFRFNEKIKTNKHYENHELTYHNEEDIYKILNGDVPMLTNLDVNNLYGFYIRNGEIEAVNSNKQKVTLSNLDNKKSGYVNDFEIVDVIKTRFGFITETIDSLFVECHNGKCEEFKNFTNFRTFPKAKNHNNQLHIVFDDYMSVFAFDIPNARR